jgi:hypothetical protein
MVVISIRNSAVVTYGCEHFLSLQGNNRLRLLGERILKRESGYRTTEIIGNLNHT